MNKNIKSLLVLVFIAFAFVGCNKFQDGPKFSLLTKKMRLTGHWKIEKATMDGADVTSVYQAFISEFDINKDKTYKITGTASDDGKWSLGEDKDDLMTVSDAPGANMEVYRILRLANKEMWLRKTQPNGTYLEMHFIQ